MIAGPLVDLKDSIELLQQHDTGQVMGKGHGGHGQAQDGGVLYARGQTIGATDEKDHAGTALQHPVGHAPGQIFAGEKPTLHTQGHRQSALGDAL